jgi:3-deoxy-D-manno-octulosonate 8-phosphate phosphatase (KDO 8-P phosphatase)
LIIEKNLQLNKIDQLLLDVDGVLTDGTIIYNDHRVETKAFNVKDGLGIRLLKRAGVRIGIMTARQSAALYRRCKDLDIDMIHDGIKDKAVVLKQIIVESQIPAENTAFIGDDLTDLPVMRRVGFPIAVADAHEVIRKNAKCVTVAKGGGGAVREVCDAILQAKGLWETILETYM